MHALRKIHQALVPGGILLDMHPIPPSTRAEVGGRSLGEFDDAEFFEIVAATEAPLEATDLFVCEAETEFDWLERYDSGAELLEDLKSWEGLHVPCALAARIRKAEPPVDIWERVVLRAFTRPAIVELGALDAHSAKFETTVAYLSRFPQRLPSGGKRGANMRARWLIAGGLAVAAIGAGTAIATHVPEVPPGTVPVGFLATHNDVDQFNVKNFRRAARHRDADVFVQHAFIPAGVSTPWHTHPGPVIVTVVDGILNYQREEGHGRHRRCETTPYTAGNGFVDPGFGHVHRAIAGPNGVHFYATYVLPTGSANHLILTDPPGSCT